MPRKRIRKNPRHQTKTPGNGKAGDSGVFGPDRQLFYFSERYRILLLALLSEDNRLRYSVLTLENRNKTARPDFVPQ